MIEHCSHKNDPPYDSDNPWGYFDAEPEVRWCPNGRDVELLNSFNFVDKYGVCWHCSRNHVVNGSSIPKFLWFIFGSPFVGKHRMGSVPHDLYCENKKRPSVQVHEMYYNAMRCAGVNPVKAYLMWLGVRLGGPRFEGV